LLIEHVFCDLEESLEEIKSWKWWLDEEETYMADLSRRPTCSQSDDGIIEFGVEGCFRQMNNTEYE